MVIVVRQARAEVDALEVGTPYRRHGIGKRLMREVERWARNHGAERAVLTTFAGSPLSVPFYEQGMGYRRRSIVFEKRLD
jgi:GNAT superfamily N-acetyltransferase